MDSFDKSGSTRTVVPLHTGPHGLHSSTHLLCISAGCICVKGHRKGTQPTQVIKFSQYEFSLSNTLKLHLFLLTLVGCLLGYGGRTGEWIDKDGPGLCVSLPWLWATGPSSSCSCQSPFHLLLRVTPGLNSFGCGFHQSSRETSKKQIGEVANFIFKLKLN